MKQRVLVTGASKGIGRAIAIALSEHYEVAIHYHSDYQGAIDTQALMHSSDKHHLLQFDVADREQCREVISSDIQANGAYYGVINNAGICRDVVFPSMSGQDWDEVIHTNLDSFYNVINPCVLPMIQNRQGGRIIALTSVSGLIGNRGQVNYSASKAGIIGASKALALELAKRKITVNCVAPGLIETDMIDHTHIEEVLKMIPSRRLGQPEEVAGTVAFLMSDVASYITREVISVNGGLI